MTTAGGVPDRPQQLADRHAHDQAIETAIRSGRQRSAGLGDQRIDRRQAARPCHARDAASELHACRRAAASASGHCSAKNVSAARSTSVSADVPLIQDLQRGLARPASAVFSQELVLPIFASERRPSRRRPSPPPSPCWRGRRRPVRAPPRPSSWSARQRSSAHRSRRRPPSARATTADAMYSKCGRRAANEAAQADDRLVTAGLGRAHAPRTESRTRRARAGP